MYLNQDSEAVVAQDLNISRHLCGGTMDCSSLSLGNSRPILDTIWDMHLFLGLNPPSQTESHQEIDRRVGHSSVLVAH